MTQPVWLITASSNGFGKSIALEALRRGHVVYATGRSLSRLSELKNAGARTAELDVTWEISKITAVVSKIAEEAGRIDYLVNSAGYILEGALEETTYVFRFGELTDNFRSDQSFAQFNTNVLGMMNVTRAVLPYMRSQKSGAIANFGSLGSWRGGPAFSNYAGTKWACSGISESMTAELKPLGIDVTVVEPGYFRTGFLNAGARIKAATTIDDYTNSVVGQVKKILDDTDNKQLGDVDKGAKVIVDVLTKTGVAEGREIPIRLPLGTDIIAGIKSKIDDTLKLLEEWDSVISSTDHDDKK